MMVPFISPSVALLLSQREQQHHQNRDIDDLYAPMDGACSCLLVVGFRVARRCRHHQNFNHSAGGDTSTFVGVVFYRSAHLHAHPAARVDDRCHVDHRKL
jgi:hypothetical protein